MQGIFLGTINGPDAREGINDVISRDGAIAELKSMSELAIFQNKKIVYHLDGSISANLFGYLAKGPSCNSGYYYVNVKFTPHANQSDKIGIEEGDYCNRNGCLGTIVLSSPVNCYCFAGVAPCVACTSTYLYCDTCGIELDSE